MADSIICKNCGAPITSEPPSGDPAHREPCPLCGSMVRNFILEAESGSYEIKGSPASLTHSSEFVRRNPPLVTLLIVLTFGGPFLGLVLAGIPGVIVGLALAVICWALGPRAIERVIEHITR